MGDIKRYCFDTNGLLRKPDIMLIADEIIIPYKVIEELDKIKMEHNTERGYQAREAVRKIKEIEDKVTFELSVQTSNVLIPFKNNDDFIIECAVRNDATIITADYLVQLKAKARGIKYIPVDELDEDSDSNYTGIKEFIFDSSIQEDNNILSSLYEKQGNNILNLRVNQYLIIRDKSNIEYVTDNGKVIYKCIDTLRWNGSEFVKLKLPKTKSIKPLNEQQACALDLLNNLQIPIKIIAGTYGSGKTLLSVKMAIHHVVEEGNYSKIMVCRNPIGSGEQIGFLAGDFEQKTEGFFKPFIQHLEGGEDEAFYLEQRGQLAKEIPFYMKGLSLSDTFVYVDEAEDFNVKMLKLLGTRIESDSCIVFSGDWKQSEGKYTNSNGLRIAIDKLKGNPLVGIVVLNEDVRSDASKAFAELD